MAHNQIYDLLRENCSLYKFPTSHYSQSEIPCIALSHAQTLWKYRNVKNTVMTIISSENLFTHYPECSPQNTLQSGI